jgi:hypothetical protein
MISARRRLLAVAAAVAMWATFQSGTVSAQTSGIGGPNSPTTVFRWVGNYADGTYDILSLWALDANLNYLRSAIYGPYPGYTALFVTTVNNGNSYILWQYQDGSINLWTVDPNLNYVTSQAYGPYSGWTAEGLSADTNGLNSFRVIWVNANYGVDVWEMDQNLNFVTSQTYGPYSAWYPGVF